MGGLSILLVNFHGFADTVACLESLQAAELGDASVLLLDNGSGRAEAERLKQWNLEAGFFAGVDRIGRDAGINKFTKANRLFVSGENLGFAGGNNLLTRVAMGWGDTEVLLLNNDTVVTPDFLTGLRAGRARHPSAVLIPQIRLYDRPAHLWNCGGELCWPGRKTYKYEGAPVTALPQNEDIRVSFVTGCALLYQPDRTGLLTEQFFFGEEDMEFSRRLRDRKIPAYCISAAIVFHRVGSSLPAGPRKSEIFTLRRLVNLRTNVGGVEAVFGWVLYLISLARLLLLRYRCAPGYVGRTVRRTIRHAQVIDVVGRDYCVDYVRGGDHPVLPGSKKDKA